MRITSLERIAGHPVLAIRRLLRSRTFTLERICEILDVDREGASQVAKSLQKLGYLEPAEHASPTGEPWTTTLKGNALAGAKAARPLTRATAERLVRGLLERVEQVNDDDEYVYRVERVIVFGSFLRDVPSLGDVDVAVQLGPKFPAAEQEIHDAKKIEEALQAGRRFRNIVDEVHWPREAVLRFLKNRSRGLSLHSSHDRILEQTETRVLYSTSSRDVT